MLHQWAEKTYNRSCALCKFRRPIESDPNSVVPFDSHLRDHVGYYVTLLTTQVLVFSLFDSSFGSFMVFLDRYPLAQSSTRFEYLASSLHTALIDRNPCSWEAGNIIDHILGLIGHKVQHRSPNLDYRHWITTSYRGQVLLPHIFLQMSLEDSPCLRFMCLSGVLTLQGRPKGETFQSLVSVEETKRHSGEMTTVPDEQIQSLARFSNLQSEWQCRVESSSIHVHLYSKDQMGPYMRVNPGFILRACQWVVFIPRCDHSKDPIKHESLLDYVFVHPDSFFVPPEATDPLNRIRVYAVRGNEAVRMMILGTIYAYVPSFVGISKDACLRCSVIACQVADAKFLIC